MAVPRLALSRWPLSSMAMDLGDGMTLLYLEISEENIQRLFGMSMESLLKIIAGKLGYEVQE